MNQVLERFGLTQADLIAEAGEARVYRLDDARILRIPRTPDEVGFDSGHAFLYARSKIELCDEFRDQVPFAVPRLLDHGTVEGVPYLIEERIAGRSMDLVLPGLDGARRERALAAYADAGIALTRIEVDRPWVGEFLTQELIRRESWSEYLVARSTHQFDRARDALMRDVTGVEDIFARFVEATSAVGDVPLGVVHGDLFPANVMVNDDLEITGIIDFGFSTLVGDQRVDLVGATCFIEVERPWTRPGDGPIVRRYIEDRVPSVREVEWLYRTYYAIFWAFTNEFKIPLYDWCVSQLRGEAQRADGA